MEKVYCKNCKHFKGYHNIRNLIMIAILTSIFYFAIIRLLEEITNMSADVEEQFLIFLTSLFITFFFTRLVINSTTYNNCLKEVSSLIIHEKYDTPFEMVKGWKQKQTSFLNPYKDNMNNNCKYYERSISVKVI